MDTVDRLDRLVDSYVTVCVFLRYLKRGVMPLKHCSSKHKGRFNVDLFPKEVMLHSPEKKTFSYETTPVEQHDRIYSIETSTLM